METTLTYSENEATLVLQKQNIDQLQLLLQELTSPDFKDVQYFVLPHNRTAFPILLTTLIDFITIELEYKGGYDVS